MTKFSKNNFEVFEAEDAKVADAVKKRLFGYRAVAEGENAMNEKSKQQKFQIITGHRL